MILHATDLRPGDRVEAGPRGERVVKRTHVYSRKGGLPSRVRITWNTGGDDLYPPSEMFDVRERAEGAWMTDEMMKEGR